MPSLIFLTPGFWNALLELESQTMRAGEMAAWLRALAVLAEIQVQFPVLT